MSQIEFPSGNKRLDTAHHVADLARSICVKAYRKIDAALDVGKPIQIVKLSEEIAAELNLKKTDCYHIISMYISHQDDIEVKKGPHGGIVRKHKLRNINNEKEAPQKEEKEKA